MGKERSHKKLKKLKKSECYRLAQMAVLGDEALLPSVKLDVLQVLMSEEKVQQLCEGTPNEKESEVTVD